jgi:hypothetical protein
VEKDSAPSRDNLVTMSQSSLEKPKWIRKFRWGWFAIAAIGILQTPMAVINAVHLVGSNHRLAPIIPIAFVIRFGMIWLFLKLWWDTRPIKETLKS